MRTINKRIILIVSVVMIFLLFTILLMFSMFSNAREYALKSVNAHLYENGVLTSAGEIVDANGIKLAYTQDGERKYNNDPRIRSSVLHILGDNKGFISGGIQDTFKNELSGYNIIYGVNKESKNTLNLTLDAELCASAYNELGSYKGCIAVCNYKTGELICVASTPSYDIYNKPEDIDTNPDYEGIYINRLYGGLYTPGSVFKVVTAMAAIENISDIYNRTYYCDGKDGAIICNDVHGKISFKTALNQSCNVAFAQIAVELGAEKIKEAFHKAGLDVSYENNDRISTKASILNITASDTDADIGWTGIGQSTTLVNPYSFLNFMCAIANGGKSYEPYFVKSAVNENGRKVYEAEPLDSGITISPTTTSLLKELLRSDVSDYYGDYLFGDVTMCGKTGTAERDNGLPHAWFAGFSYDDNFPYAVIAILEDSGSGLKYAGSAASSIMQELYKKTIN
ncbi:MAG: hypothetical protein IKM66_00170 [Clostridia bacterium]|nr:hypothetical protein [Clostridia bacterium]